METHEVEHLVSRMDGWLTEKEGVLLYNLARNCQGKGVIAEIGSWKGKSTIWLAYGSKQGKNVRIYAIDPHTGSSSHREKYGSIWTFDEFQKNIRDAVRSYVKKEISPIIEDYAQKAEFPQQIVERLAHHQHPHAHSDGRSLADGRILEADQIGRAV